MRRRIIELLVILIAVAAVCSAGSREVRIALHLDPELPLDGTENVYVGPILIEPREGENVQSVDLTAAREFELFLRKILRRDAQLHLIPKRDDLKPQRNNLAALLLDTEFWRAIREESAADYVVAASIDVKVLDRAGYTTEEYVSPQDGKTYFRQVMVEETGFSYDADHRFSAEERAEARGVHRYVHRSLHSPESFGRHLRAAGSAGQTGSVFGLNRQLTAVEV